MWLWFRTALPNLQRFEFRSPNPRVSPSPQSSSSTRKAAMQLVRKLVEFHPYGPALKGSGDERAKATKLLNEIQEGRNMLEFKGVKT